MLLVETGTALGRPESGEGVIGLVQAFQIAGVRHVIASLWPVDDEATCLLMGRLYELLARRDDPLAPSEALRQASAWLKTQVGAEGRSLASPRHWAAFVCYGQR